MKELSCQKQCVAQTFAEHLKLGSGRRTIHYHQTVFSPLERIVVGRSATSSLWILYHGVTGWHNWFVWNLERLED